jgi:hypothetical protein
MTGQEFSPRRHGEEQNKNLETQRNGGSGGKDFFITHEDG